jgi:hypothetical protein
MRTPWTIYPGAVFRRTITNSIETGGVKTPIDMTGYTGRWSIRRIDGTLVHEANVGNGGFVLIDAVNGVFRLTVPAATTATFTPSTVLQSDLFWTPPAADPEFAFEVAVTVDRVEVQ